MICFQNLFCFFQIHGIFRKLFPRHIQHNLDVSSEHRALGGTVSHSLEPGDFFLYLVLHLFAGFHFRKTAQELIGFICDIGLSKFFPDHLELFPQHIFTLIVVNILFDLLLNVQSQIGETQFLFQKHKHELTSPF